ncbi:hypothetical protein MRX96_007536 [Rhipicephalus microplus]
MPTTRKKALKMRANRSEQGALISTGQALVHHAVSMASLVVLAAQGAVKGLPQGTLGLRRAMFMGAAGINRSRTWTRGHSEGKGQQAVVLAVPLKQAYPACFKGYERRPGPACAQSRRSNTAAALAPKGSHGGRPG